MTYPERYKPPPDDRVIHTPTWFTDEMLARAKELYPQYEFKRMKPLEEQGLLAGPWRIHE